MFKLPKQWFKVGERYMQIREIQSNAILLTNTPRVFHIETTVSTLFQRGIHVVFL